MRYGIRFAYQRTIPSSFSGYVFFHARKLQTTARAKSPKTLVFACHARRLTGSRWSTMCTWFRGDEQYLLMRVEVEGSPIPECSRSRKRRRTFSDSKNTDVLIRPKKSTGEFPTPRWYYYRAEKVVWIRQSNPIQSARNNPKGYRWTLTKFSNLEVHQNILKKGSNTATAVSIPDH